MVQRTFFQTQLSYLEALRSLRISEIEIEGLLLSGSLDSAANPSGGAAATDGQFAPVGAIGIAPR